MIKIGDTVKVLNNSTGAPDETVGLFGKVVEVPEGYSNPSNCVEFGDPINDFWFYEDDELEVIHRLKKVFLECLLNDLDNFYEGSDEEVEQELLEMGIDLKKAKRKFDELLEKVKK